MNVAFYDVHVTLGGQQILHGLNLTAQHGKLTGIIGPNGCGKSTLIKTLFGIVPMESGRIFLGDTDAFGMTRRQIAQCVGYVGQDVPCVFDFSVYDVVEMALYARRGLSRNQRSEIIMDALNTIGIADFANRSLLTLSGGERKLVFIARALAQGVDTIILDEPTNHLDIRHQLFILDILKNSGKTILIVLHDLRLAAHYCDHLYLMQSGKILDSGTSLDILTPGNVQTAFGIHGHAYQDAIDGADFHIDFSMPAL